MGAGEIIPEKYRKIGGKIAFVLFIAAELVCATFVLSWLALLLSFIGITHWPEAPTMNNLILYFCLSFAMVCALLWLASQVDLIKLKESAQKTIGRSFVVLVLGGVVTAFTKLLQHH